MRDFYRFRGQPVRVQCSSGTISGVLHSVTPKSLWLLVAGDDRFVPISSVVAVDLQA